MSTDPGGLILAAVITAVVGLLVMESYQTTPWLAGKMIKWSVCLRYTDNSERAKVRGEELISLLEDLPTLFKLPTASGFLFRALVYRLANRRSHVRREVRAVRRSLGARFRNALVKAGLVVACTATVFVIEVAFALTVVGDRLDFLELLGLFGLPVGIAAASEVVAQPSRLYPGFVGGIMYALSMFTWGAAGIYQYLDVSTPAGVAFGVAVALVSALTGRFKYAGFILGVLANLAAITAATAVVISEATWAWESLAIVALGFAAGTLAGFVVAVERITRARWNPEPPTAIDAIDEPHDKRRLGMSSEL